MRPEQVLSDMCRGLVALARGDFERAETHMNQALSTARLSGSDYLVARVLRALAVVAVREGDLQEARTLQEESLAAARETDDIARDHLLTDFAWRALIERDFEKARQLAEECIAARSLETERSDPAVQHTLVLALLGLGRTFEAETLAKTALAEAWFRNDIVGTSALLDALAACSADRGDHGRAALLCGAAARALERVGIDDHEVTFGRSTYAELLEASRAQGEAAWERESAYGATLPTPEVVAIALTPRDEIVVP